MIGWTGSMFLPLYCDSRECFAACNERKGECSCPLSTTPPRGASRVTASAPCASHALHARMQPCV